MRNRHALKSLDIEGKEIALSAIPEFDFYKLNSICSLRLEWQDESSGPDNLSLAVTAIYEQGASYRVSIRFGAVRQILLPELHDRGWFVSELEIEDISTHQLEGVRYKVTDCGSERFEVLCERIGILACEPM